MAPAKERAAEADRYGTDSWPRVERPEGTSTRDTGSASAVRDTGSLPPVRDAGTRDTGSWPAVRGSGPRDSGARDTGSWPAVRDSSAGSTDSWPTVTSSTATELSEADPWSATSAPTQPVLAYAPDMPEPADRGNRLLITLAFWFTLAASVELWWLDTPGKSITNAAGILTESGRITGMIAGFILLVQVLMMSRVGWLERFVGAHDLMIWHRELGGFLLPLVFAHVILIIGGYAALSHKSFTGETWSMVTTFEDMVSASIATLLLVSIGVLAIRSIRRRMPYEMWYFLHLFSYLVLLLSYGHQFADGQELMNGGFGTWYWALLYFFVIACLAWGRVLGPILLNLRHRLRVVDVVPEGNDMVSIYVGGSDLDDMRARAGQYFRWRFLARGCWYQAHPFSLSAAPNGRWLRLTIKVVGDHTEDLQYLEPGTRVWAEGPSGVFTADRRVRPRALLIAGGSGIAPIRALLEDLPPGTAVIYRASSEAELVFRQELDWLAQRRGARVWYVLGSRNDPGPKKVFSPRGMRQLVPDIRRRDVFLCGPEGLVSAALRNLRQLRVPRRQIHMDPFEF